MIWLLTIHLLLFVIYCFIMLFYQYWYAKLKPIEYVANATTTIGFSIVIPARNEAENIATLLHCLLAQHYNKQCIEIIVVDDYSTDNTAAIVATFAQQHPQIKLLELSKIVSNKNINSYKKKAIELAIAESQFDWIITTDADCTMGNNWLNSFNNYIQNTKAIFIAAPVAFTSNGSCLHNFQQLDFLGLQGITGAAVSAGIHAMCNGANLCYKKDAFCAVNGFKEIDTIASGDDMLLMTKMKKHFPNKLGYLFCKQAIVSTAPLNTVGAFMQQRVRWASKTNSYKEPFTIVILWLVLLVNIGICIMPLGVFYQISVVYYWLLLLLIKTLVEGTFAYNIAGFYSIKLTPKMLLLQYPHIVYTSIAGIMGALQIKYTWKGRNVK